MDLAWILKIAGLVSKYGPVIAELFRQLMDELTKPATMGHNPDEVESEIKVLVSKLAAYLQAKSK